MTGKDPLLTKGVHLAKQATAEHPIFFTLVLKGGMDGALRLSKKKGTAKDIKELKEQCGGTAVLRGRCFLEEGKLVFETPKLPAASMPKALKTILHREAGVNLAVAARHAPDLAEEEDQPTTEEGTPVVADEAAAVPEKKVSNVVFTQARLVWDATRKAVQRQLQGLEKQILTVCQQINNDPQAEVEIDLSELTDNVKTIYTILDSLDQRLIDKLDEALNAKTPEERTALHQEAAVIVKEYQAYLTDDPLVNAIDANGFVPLTVRETVLAALNGLASKL